MPLTKRKLYVPETKPIRSDFPVGKEGKAEYDRVLKRWKTINDSDYRATNAKYRAEHKKEIVAYQAKYKAEHKEEVAAYDAKYYAEHKEEKTAYNANNYTKNKELAEKLHGTHCSICGSNLFVDWAHIDGNAIKSDAVAGLYDYPTPDAWQEEAKKCVRLCRSCHNKYDKGWAKEHGQSWPSLNRFAESIRNEKFATKWEAQKT